MIYIAMRIIFLNLTIFFTLSLLILKFIFTCLDLIFEYTRLK